jgi:hypothetical protein
VKNKFLVSLSKSGSREGNISLIYLDSNFQITNCLSDSVFTDGNQGTTIVKDKIYTLGLDTLYELDLRFFFLRQHKFKYSGAHGLWHHDNKLYCVLTFSRKVCVVDIKTFEEIPELEYTHTDFIPDEEGEHINSFFVDDHNMVITVHGHDKEGYAYTVQPDGKKFVIIRNLHQPHNCYLINDGLVVCESKLAQFICKRQPLENSFRTDCNAYTRGVCWDDNYFYVGNTDRKSTVKSIIMIDKISGILEKSFTLNSLEGRCCPEVYSVIKIDD